MKRLLPLTFAFALLAACTDTTGLSGALSRPPHPSTNPNAAVHVQEFADLQCPACKAAHEQVVKPLVQKYGTKIRYDFMHFPLRSLHRYALEAAEAAECAADQEKFWEFVDMNYANQGDLDSAALTQWAQTLGLNMDTFERCVSSHIKRDAILAEYDEGQQLGARGTPTFFVNGTRVEATMDDLSTAIDAASQGVGSKL